MFETSLPQALAKEEGTADVEIMKGRNCRRKFNISIAVLLCCIEEIVRRAVFDTLSFLHRDLFDNDILKTPACRTESSKNTTERLPKMVRIGFFSFLVDSLNYISEVCCTV